MYNSGCLKVGIFAPLCEFVRCRRDDDDDATVRNRRDGENEASGGIERLTSVNRRPLAFFLPGENLIAASARNELGATI